MYIVLFNNQISCFSTRGQTLKVNKSRNNVCLLVVFYIFSVDMVPNFIHFATFDNGSINVNVFFFVIAKLCLFFCLILFSKESAFLGV